jgi:hypothetical protein
MKDDKLLHMFRCTGLELTGQDFTLTQKESWISDCAKYYLRKSFQFTNKDLTYLQKEFNSKLLSEILGFAAFHMSNIQSQNYSPFSFKRFLDTRGGLYDCGKRDDIAISIGIVADLEPTSDEKNKLIDSLQQRIESNDAWLKNSVVSMIEYKISKGVLII